MKLLRCHILGFGKLADLALSFSGGLNIVSAANEAGKSTLLRFLTSALYGQLRADIKAQRRLDAWVEQYKPWHAPAYGGVLWCRLANGRELELHRSFGRDETRFEVLTSGGEDITGEYESQRNGEVIFAAPHLGLSKEIFESVAVVRETETAEFKHRESLRDRVANLAQSGDEKLSVRLSLVKLEEAMESIGSERAPTRPYRQALDRLQSMRDERDELEAQRRQCQAWVQERMQLAKEIEGLEQEMQAAGRGVLNARWREARLRVRTLEDLQGEIHGLRSEIASLNARQDFPVGLTDDLNRLVADKDNAEQRLGELRRQKQEMEARRERGEQELRKLAPYASLHANIGPEKITEWFVHYLGISRQRDDVQRTLNQLLSESAELERALASLSPVLQDEEIDWELRARQAADEERVASQQSLALSEQLAQRRSDLARLSGKASRQGLFAGLALSGSVAAVAGVLLSLLPAAPGIGLAVVLGATGVAMLSLASRSRAAARQVNQTIETLQGGLKALRDRAHAVQNELGEAVAKSGLPNVEDFLAAARRAGMQRQRLEDLSSRIRSTEQQQGRIQAEADEVYAHLKECLTQAGLACAPGNLKVPVDLLRNNMRRYADLQTSQRHLAREIDALLADEASVSARVTEIDARIQAILIQAGVDSPESFREASRNSLRAQELGAREESRLREFERLRGSLTLDQWRARLEELQSLRGMPDEEGAEETPPRQLPYLPYLPTVEEAEQIERRLADTLAERREDHARLVERVRQAFHNYRSPAEIEEDIGTAERVTENLALSREALSLALDSIQTLARLQQEACAPQLNRMAEERFLQVCNERYEEVKIDPDFRIQVRERGTMELRPAECLSRGTQDQLYLAVRFAVLELLGNSQEPSPCLLDEPFVAYDHERMCAAFRILEQEASQRQLILFTCREDIRALGLQHSAHFVTL